MAGGVFVEVETAAEMAAALGAKTAMMVFLGDAADNGNPGKVRKTPEVGPTSACYSCGNRMHGPTSFFWANLTPFSLKVSFEEMAAMARGRGVPLLVDAAAERPDVPNVYIAGGADIVCYSGGKVLRGPQSAGLMIGKAVHVKNAMANQAPAGGFGRPMKTGKEEIMGCLAAVEQWSRRDHDAEWAEFDRRLQTIADAAKDFPGVETRAANSGGPGGLT